MPHSILDFLICAAVVAVAFLGGYAYGKSSRAPAHPVRIEWTV